MSRPLSTDLKLEARLYQESIRPGSHKMIYPLIQFYVILICVLYLAQEIMTSVVWESSLYFQTLL